MRSIGLITALVLSAAAATAGAQAHPLPASLVASWGHSWAGEFWLPTEGEDFVRAKLTFDNAGAAARVNIEWFFQRSGYPARHSDQLVEVPFKPTAVARRAGTTSTMYVVGWSEDTGRVVVESWRFGAFTLGAAARPEGDPCVSVVELPPITRTLVWTAEPALPPIRDAACEVFGNSLFLLDSGPLTRIWSLDLGTLTLTELFNETDAPALKGARALSAAMHEGRFILTTRVSSPWAPHGPPGKSVYFVMKDTDCDGDIDATATEVADQFYLRYPPPWDNRFSEP